jgi:hypothetical protein
MITVIVQILLMALLSQPGTKHETLPISAQSTCAALVEAFDAALRAQKTCTVNADCACYPDLRIDGRLGVTDRRTAARVTVLSNQYRRQQCPTIFVDTAGPAICLPRCDARACRQ